jgi:transcription initiation factor TFIIIB Brf1 subunit/transcription initiation factor TFIIB
MWGNDACCPHCHASKNEFGRIHVSGVVCSNCAVEYEDCIFVDVYVQQMVVDAVDHDNFYVSSSSDYSAKKSINDRNEMLQLMMSRLKIDSNRILADACTYYAKTKVAMNPGDRCDLVRAACIYTALRGNGNTNEYDTFRAKMGITDKKAFTAMVGKVEKANPGAVNNLKVVKVSTCVAAHLNSMIVNGDIEHKNESRVRAKSLEIDEIRKRANIMIGGKSPSHQAFMCIYVACFVLGIDNKKIKRNAREISPPTITKYIRAFKDIYPCLT